MKALVFLSLAFFTLYANEKVIATKIVKSISQSISLVGKKIWIPKNQKSISDFLDVQNLNITSHCQDAGVLILDRDIELPRECFNTPILVLDYELLHSYDNAVAAFFWKKGRPNIVFIDYRLEHFKIELDPSYDKFIEEKIW